MKKENRKNYMEDLYPNENLEDAVFHNSPLADERTVNGEAYLDPDSDCRRLYEEVMKCFLGVEDVQGIGNTGKHYTLQQGTAESYERLMILETDEGLKLTTDYIGPSATSAAHAGVEDSFVWETILACRNIGGHMIWPAYRGGINPSKARSGNVYSGISDRMDVALYEIRNFLENIEAEKLNPALWNAFAQKETADWLRSFKKDTNKSYFEAFCDQFAFKGSFVNDNYDIIWLAPMHMKKATREEVVSFFRKNTEAIQKRLNQLTHDSVVEAVA